MDKNNIINEYFEWMTNIVCGKRFSGKVTYKKLLSCLHMITFRCEMRSDENRAEDGVDLRWRFAVDTGRENQNAWHYQPYSYLYPYLWQLLVKLGQ